MTMIDEDENPEGWRIGDTRPCGCPVEATSRPCERHQREWGVAQTDCGDCEYGIPGVWHEYYGCDGED